MRFCGHRGLGAPAAALGWMSWQALLRRNVLLLGKPVEAISTSNWAHWVLSELSTRVSRMPVGVLKDIKVLCTGEDEAQEAAACSTNGQVAMSRDTSPDEVNTSVSLGDVRAVDEGVGDASGGTEGHRGAVRRR